MSLLSFLFFPRIVGNPFALKYWKTATTTIPRLVALLCPADPKKMKQKTKENNMGLLHLPVMR